MLKQTNGIFDRGDCAVIDDVDNVCWMNHVARQQDDYMPLDHLLFVSRVYGNGDLVGFGIACNGDWTGLYRWDHEADGARPRI